MPSASTLLISVYPDTRHFHLVSLLIFQFQYPSVEFRRISFPGYTIQRNNVTDARINGGGKIGRSGRNGRVNARPIYPRERDRGISTPRFGFIDELLIRFADRANLA